MPHPTKGTKANIGPCLTGRQEASRGQGWEPTQGPTGDFVADARGPASAVQSVPAVSGGPQVAKGRLAPEGLEGRGWIEKGSGEEAGASQERMRLKGRSGGTSWKEGMLQSSVQLRRWVFLPLVQGTDLKAFRMKDVCVISNQRLLAWAREPGGRRGEGGPKGLWITQCVSDLGLGQFHKHLALHNPSPAQRGL